MISKLPVAIMVAAMIWLAPNASAQAPSDSAVPAPTGALATLLQGGPIGELLSVSVPRTEHEVEQLLDDARRLEQSAAGEIEAGRGLVIEAEGRTKIMKQELETTKARLDAAKKTKDKAKAEEYDAAVKKQSRELKYLTQLQAALEADTDRLESAKAAAAATAGALERERALVRKLKEIGVSTPSPEAIKSYRNELQGMLEAQRDAATKGYVAADKKKKLAEQRLKQLAALAKL